MRALPVEQSQGCTLPVPSPYLSPVQRILGKYVHQYVRNGQSPNGTPRRALAGTIQSGQNAKAPSPDVRFILPVVRNPGLAPWRSFAT